MAYGTVNADVIGTSVANSNLGAGNATRFKNRLINGDQRIDQRNAGASGTGTNNFVTDRWKYVASQASKGTWGQNLGSVTPPVGYTNYLGFSSSSAYSVASGDYFLFEQRIEGLNIADLAWGTASAKTVTLSFQVYSSLTGTFGGYIQNSGSTRSYPFTYTISSASTWTQISVTIPGDTTGTWLTTNGIGIEVGFSLGTGSTYVGTANTWAATQYNAPSGAINIVGTNAATWYVTAIQLEVGSSATGFDYRDYTTELSLCSRYYQSTYNIGISAGSASNASAIARTLDATQPYPTLAWCMPTVMRTTPTTTYYSPVSGASGKACTSPGNADVAAGVWSFDGMRNVTLIINGISVSQSYGLFAHFTCSAEL